MSSGPFAATPHQMSVDVAADPPRSSAARRMSSLAGGLARGLLVVSLLVALLAVAALVAALTAVVVLVAAPWWIYRHWDASLQHRSPSKGRAHLETGRGDRLTLEAPSGG